MCTYVPKDCIYVQYHYLLDVLERDTMIFISSTIQKLPAFFMLIIYVRSYFDYEG